MGTYSTVMYLVAINETTRMQMYPYEIVGLQSQGMQLDIVIVPVERDELIYG